MLFDFSFLNSYYTHLLLYLRMSKISSMGDKESTLLRFTGKLRIVRFMLFATRNAKWLTNIFRCRNRGPDGVTIEKSWQRSECSLWSASKPLRQWKEPRSFLPLKLGNEQMNKVPGKVKISYVLVEIFERPLNIPKRRSIENIERSTPSSPIWEHSDLCQDFNATRFIYQGE